MPIHSTRTFASSFWLCRFCVSSIRGPRPLHSQTRGAAVAISLTADRQVPEAVPVCSLHIADAAWPFAPTACEHKVCGILLLLLTRTEGFEWRKRRGTCTIATCDLLQAFARGTTLLLGKPRRCPRGCLGPQRRVGTAAPTSGKAVCLALKRKGTFAPSSRAEGASAGLKPMKASWGK